MADKASRRNLPTAPAKGRRGRNQAAIERTIAYLRRSDRLLPGDDATLAIVRTTAENLDGATGTYDRTLAARVHLVAVSALMAGHSAPTDDDLASIRAILGAS